MWTQTEMKKIKQPGGATCNDCKFEHQVAPFAFVDSQLSHFCDSFEQSQKNMEYP